MTAAIELLPLEARNPGTHTGEAKKVSEFINGGQGLVTVAAILGELAGRVEMSYDGGDNWIKTVEFGNPTLITATGPYEATLSIQPAPLIRGVMVITSKPVQAAMHFIPFTKSRKARTIDV